ncbi:MAG: hypothetical protein ACK4K4_06005 [Caldimicrobium sp.]
MNDKEKEKDSILTIKDWIESFWDFQEEDLKLFMKDFREKFKDPKAFISEIKNRIQTRKAFYKIFKHLSIKDIPAEELPFIERKLEEILAREAFITENMEKILEIFSSLFSEECLEDLKEKTIYITEDRIIFH